MNRRELDEVQKAPEQAGPGFSILLRGLAIVLAFVVGGGYLVVQLKRIQVDEYEAWRTRASLQQLSSTELPAGRGDIYDVNGNVLATTVTVWTVESSPDVLAKSKMDTEAAGTKDIARFASQELARILELDEETLYENLSDPEKKYYRVKQKIEKPVADEIRELVKTYNISGISLVQDTKRYYPYQDLAASVLGFVNDDGGAEGLENYYDEVLTGVSGREVSVVNAWGGDMPSGNDSITYDPVNGYNLELTLNAEIQQVVEKYLARAVEEHEAKERGMCIVMDTKTGAVLAMATYPSYDPNQPYYIWDDATREAVEAIEDDAERSQAQGAARILQWRNKAVADTYEPGSVFKVITAAAALDSGIYSLNSYFVCSGSIHVEGWNEPMRCAGSKSHGNLSLSTALVESCNVSFIQMSAGMGVSTWYDYLNAFGFTEPTGIDIAGEPSQNAVNNLVYSESAMGPVELASVSFGQSNKYTALQMITAVSAAVNGGHLMQPYMVSAVTDENGNVIQSFEPTEKRQVISAETSAQIAETLEYLVAETDNGHRAHVAGYHVGGKSGTSQKLEIMNQEDRDAYLSSFLGFAPANDPEVAVLFVLDEPNDKSGYGTWFGGRMAAPSVGSIISEIMPIMGIEPDYTNDEDLLRTAISVPNLTGKTEETAQTELNNRGLSYLVVGSGNTVTGQYPELGGEVPYAGQVVLYMDGAATETVQVPNLLEQTAGSARSTLQNMGLNVLTEGDLDSGDTVRVFAQSIEAGTEVPKGTTVILTMQNTQAVGDI